MVHSRGIHRTGRRPSNPPRVSILKDCHFSWLNQPNVHLFYLELSSTLACSSNSQYRNLAGHLFRRAMLRAPPRGLRLFSVIYGYTLICGKVAILAANACVQSAYYQRLLDGAVDSTHPARQKNLKTISNHLSEYHPWGSSTRFGSI